MSIMDMFKPKADDKKSNNVNTNNGVPTTGANGKENLSDPPPSTDQTGKMPGTSPVAENPLDVYKKMFENANSNSSIEAPSFSLDPKVLGDVSKKMDFTQGVDPDIMQKASSGDVQALMEVVRTVGQNSYRAALEHTTALTDTHLKQRGEYESKKLDVGVSKRLTENALSSAPNYNHPVVKSELNRIAGQISASNPDASPQQVAEAAQKYLSDLFAAINPASTQNKQEDTGETDWSKYLGGS